MSNVNETDPVQGSFITKCSESKVTAFIQQHVGPAFLKSSSARELHYILPFEEVRKGAFEKLFTALDASLESLNISSYGVMDTSLEEVFLKVAEKTGVNMSEEGKGGISTSFNLSIYLSFYLSIIVQRAA